MYRIILFLSFLCLWPIGVLAQELGGLARVDASQSGINDAAHGEVQIDLHLSQGVPYRVYTLDGPRRLVVDFQEVDWGGLKPDSLLQSTRIEDLRVGAFRPGWSRMVADLTAPLIVQTVDLAIDNENGQAHLTVVLAPGDDAAFALASGAPVDARWDLPPPADLPAPASRPADAPLMVVIDPGHGGVDPGAERNGAVEKELMLILARELREALLRGGDFDVAMTRDKDVFISLQERIAIAHQAGADVFLSLHADSLSEGQAKGATVYTLSQEATDAATAGLAERHNRADVLAGVDLSGTDDEVTGILLELARQETQPRTEALARALVDGIAKAGVAMNSRPLRRAGFSVLKAADIPSILIEVGFLSNDSDVENLNDPEWRASIVSGIREGLNVWLVLDEAVRDLVRQ
ncbi:MAG: N-acetylmuramoyl-L-alanine amidase [Paracoccaceae bacterium]